MSEAPTTLALLESLDIFQGVPSGILADLLATGRMVEVEKGETVFQEGAPGDGMYLVVSGAVELTTRVSASQHQRLALLDRGQLFGELAVFDELPRSATATAFVKCQLLFLTTAAFNQLLDERPAFAPELLRNLVKKLSLRLRDADAEIRELSLARSH